MTIHLPGPLAAYLEAKRAYDTDALLATLTPDAVITDEGTVYRGAPAIRAWNDRISKAVRATYAVHDMRQDGELAIVTVEVGGNFPKRSALPARSASTT